MKNCIALLLSLIMLFSCALAEEISPAAEALNSCKEILNGYSQAALEHWDTDKLYDSDFSPCAAFFENPAENIGYELRDINSDGRLDLLVCLKPMEDAPAYDIIDLYLMDENRQPVQVLCCDEFSVFHLTGTDGEYGVYEMISASPYEISLNLNVFSGMQLECRDSLLRYEDDDTPLEWSRYVPDEGTYEAISEEEADTIRNSWIPTDYIGMDMLSDYIGTYYQK